MENKNAALKWSSEDGNESFILSVTDKLNRTSVKTYDYRLLANNHEETYFVDLTKIILPFLNIIKTQYYIFAGFCLKVHTDCTEQY